MALYIKKFPKDLHKELKIIALKNGMLLRELIELLLRREVEVENFKTQASRKGREKKCS